MERKLNDAIFASKSSEVNLDIYVPRLKLEHELIRKTEGSKNIVIYGESGCGKSWLYKKVFKEKGIHYTIINLAQAKDNNGIIKLIEKLALANENIKVGYDENKSASINVAIAKSDISHASKYIIARDLPIKMYLEKFFNRCGGFICLENTESITNHEELMTQVGNLIMLLDDAEFVKYRAKFLIVGSSRHLISYFTKSRNGKNISNRITELSEVLPFSQQQVRSFVNNEVIERSKIKFTVESDREKLFSHLFNITNGVPQSIHEYCIELYCHLQTNNWIFTNDILLNAEKDWLKNSKEFLYQHLIALMNVKNTKNARRNQVLYCLGELKSDTFTKKEIENMIKEEFPNNTKGKNIKASKPLKFIEENASPFIKSYGEQYKVIDMKFKLYISLMMKKANGKFIIVDMLEI